MRARTAGRRRRDFCERAEWSVCRRGDLFLPRARAKVVPGAMSHSPRRPLEVPPSGRDCFAFSTRRGEITRRALPVMRAVPGQALATACAIPR